MDIYILNNLLEAPSVNTKRWTNAVLMPVGLGKHDIGGGVRDYSHVGHMQLEEWAYCERQVT